MKVPVVTILIKAPAAGTNSSSTAHVSGQHSSRTLDLQHPMTGAGNQAADGVAIGDLIRDFTSHVNLLILRRATEAALRVIL